MKNKELDSLSLTSDGSSKVIHFLVEILNFYETRFSIKFAIIEPNSQNLFPKDLHNLLPQIIRSVNVFLYPQRVFTFSILNSLHFLCLSLVEIKMCFLTNTRRVCHSQFASCKSALSTN